MEHAPQAGILPDDIQAVAVRLAVMHDNGQVPLPREGELAVEKLFLAFLLGIVPVIVQADLADGGAFGVLGERKGSLQALVGIVRELFGVDADSKPDKRILRGKGGGVPAACLLAAGVQDQLDTGVLQAYHQLFPVLIKGLVVQMGVGIKIHGASLPCFGLET